jgi:phosphohistidine phosphatase
MMIIGHNPGLQDLTLALAASPDGGTAAGLTRRAVAKFPTAAIAVLAFAGAWSRLGPGGAQLIAFVTPSDLREPDRLP